MKRSFLGFIMVAVVIVLGACSKNAENEHLPEYCQTYAGFAATASTDMFELLDDAGYAVNRFNYLSVISEIELEFELDDPSRRVDLGGIQCFQNLTSLSLIGRSFKDISQISALSNIQSIELRNTSIVSIDSFKNLSKINNLVISETKTLQNVEGVGEMTKLTTLELSDNGLVNIGELNDLVNLQNLYLDNNEIVYFPSINNLEQLETLDISYNKIIQLGEDLSGLRNLEILNASHNEICDISTLDDLQSVEELDLSFNDLGCNGVGVSPDFDSLENAPNLSILKLNDNGLTSIEGLRDRDISLEVLHLQNNQLTDITPIAAYTNITELVLYGNNISNINDLSGMTGLTSIDLSDNSITDFSDLRLIPNLTSIDLSRNNISSIPDLSTAWTTLSVLNLHSNQLTDVSGIEGHPSIETLILYNNGLQVLEGISNLPELDQLIIETPEEVVLPEADINPNVISILNNSFNNNPRLSIDDDHLLDLGFEFGPNVQIINSITGNISINAINWALEDIDIIDADSIQLPNLADFDVSGNNITDISFILGNPNLTNLYLSNNPITNLDLINGIATDELDDLELVEAQNIFTGNDLVNAFIELPRLEEIDLTNTSLITIDNCFNDLEYLHTIHISTANLETITDSFNNIFDTYRLTNEFFFNTGHIGTISNSFNGGQYYSIIINAQSPFGGATLIEDSFNDLNIVSEFGLQITSSDFATITNSFHDLSSDLVNINLSQVETVTNSFVNADIDVLSLEGNELSDLPLINLATNIETLDLDQNELTTLSFVDGIPGLTAFSFLQQQSNIITPTLTTIDGVNNQPLLTDFAGDLRAITSVTGFQNLPTLTEMDLSTTNLSGSQLSSIGVDAFSGTPLTIVDLSGHELSDLTFLANLDVIEQLYIGLDVADLSDFTGLPMEATLEELILENVSAFSEFSALADYDVLSTLTLPSSVTSIDQLDGLDSLDTLLFEDMTTVTSITNSFNDLPSLTPINSFLTNFTGLLSVSTSFDIYTQSDDIIITGDYSIVDSFHNVGDVFITENDGDLVPTFDTLSFTTMINIDFEVAEYATYDFLNGYSTLTNVVINELRDDMTGLNNTTINQLTILGTLGAVSSIDIDIDTTGSVGLNSLIFGSLAIDTNATYHDFVSGNLDITLTTDQSSIELTGTTGDFTLEGANITAVSNVELASGNVIMNTPQLTTLQQAVSNSDTIDSLTVNTEVTALDIDIRAIDLTIDDDNLTTLTGVNTTGDTTIIGTETALDVNFQGLTVTVDYATLQSLTISGGQIDDLVVNSNAMTTLDATSVTFDSIDVTSNQATMDFTGSDITLLALTNDSISTLTAVVPGAVLQIQSSNTALTLDDTSTMDGLNLVSMGNIDTLHYGAATVPSITMLSTSVSMTITGSTISSISATNGSLSSIDLSIPLATLSLNVTQLTLSIDGTADGIVISSTDLVGLTLVALTDLNSLVLNTDSLTSLTSNDSNIDTLSLDTSATTLSIDASNSLDTTITGNSLTSADIDVGTNDATFTAGTGSLALNATANQLEVIAQIDDITVNDSSTLSTLIVRSTNLDTITTGTASIDTLNVTISNATLAVNGSSLTDLNITSNVNNLTLNVGTTSTVVVDTSSATPVIIDTSTNAIDVTAVADVTLSGSSLDDVTLNIGSNNADIDMDKALLDATIGGTAGDVTITGDDMDTLSFGPGTTFAALILDDLDVETLDTTGFLINIVDVSTGLSSFAATLPLVQTVIVDSTTLTTLELDAPDALNFNITGANIDDLDITNTSGTVALTGSANTLTLHGTMATFELTNDTLTSLDLSDVTVESLDLTVDSLAVLDTLSSVSNTLIIDTNQDDFDLTSDVLDISFSSDTTYTLLMTSSVVDTISLTTNTSAIDFDASSTSFDVIGANLVSALGDVDQADFSGFTSIVLVLDVNADTITISDAGSLTSLSYTGVHSLTSFDVELTNVLAIIDTNAVTIDQLTVHQNTTTQLQITTLSSDITISGEPLGGFTEVTVNYEGADPLEVVYSGLNITTVNTGSVDTLTVSGTVDDITITGTALSSVTTTSLSGSGQFTMNDTLVTTLSFATDVLLSYSTLEINTLSNGDMATLLDDLDGSTIELISPIVISDVYDHFYNTELGDLTAQEALDQARYDAFRSSAVDDAWAEVLLNEYMDHLDEISTKNDINAETLQTVDDYLNSYLTDAGITIGDLVAGEETTIRNAIQATLDEIILLMDETDLQTEVTTSIETDATTYATTETAAITFTIG